MFQILADVTCSNGLAIPGEIVSILRMIIFVIKVVVPILLIIWGMLDLGKAVMAQKEDEIKKGQQTFIKRLVAAAIVFFVIVIVQLVVTVIVGQGDSSWACVKAILGLQ